MRQLIVISGAGATGKTTLSKRLARELDVPLIAKDDIKEMLFEHLPQHDRAWSTIQGRVAIAMMYAGAKTLLDEGYHVMIESLFHPDFARADIEQIIAKDVEILEVFCFSDHTLRQERWSARARQTRHAAHLDNPDMQLELDARAPLYPDAALMIDTGLPVEQYEVRYNEIKELMMSKLTDGGRYNETTN